MKKNTQFCSLLATFAVIAAASNPALATTTIYTAADLGTYSNGGPATINITGLASHNQITIDFDLFIYDSWDGQDGGAAGPDLFGFTVDGTDYSWSFDNFYPSSPYETNLDTDFTTGNFNSINTWGAIDRYFDDYKDEFTLAHSGSTLSLRFWGSGLQGLNDESWSVKDLELTTNASNQVPEPATMFLFGTGMVGLIGSRLRKKTLK